MLKRILITGAVVIVLGACVSSPAGASHEIEVSTISGGTPSGSFWHGKVDGVECIAVDGGASYDAGTNGISCNWVAKSG